MNPGDAAPAWYPVALSADLEPGTSTGTRLQGRELVVWRDDAGVAHVWEDRCPHRGMRLSFGFVRGDRIACLYHGWQFDAGGICRFIPAHPQLAVPPTIAVERFASVERLGIVWAFSGEAVAAAVPPAADAATNAVRSLWLEVGPDDVHAALGSGAAPFDGTAAEVVRAGPLVTIRVGSASLYAAVQPVAQDVTVLHLAVDAVAADDRQRLSLWAEELRRSLEAETAA